MIYYWRLYILLGVKSISALTSKDLESGVWGNVEQGPPRGRDVETASDTSPRASKYHHFNLALSRVSAAIHASYGLGDLEARWKENLPNHVRRDV